MGSNSCVVAWYTKSYNNTLKVSENDELTGLDLFTINLLFRVLGQNGREGRANNISNIERIVKSNKVLY